MIKQSEESRACVGRIPRVLPCHASQRQGLLQIYAAQHTLIFHTTLPAIQSDATASPRIPCWWQGKKRAYATRGKDGVSSTEAGACSVPNHFTDGTSDECTSVHWAMRHRTLGWCMLRPPTGLGEACTLHCTLFTCSARQMKASWASGDGRCCPFQQEGDAAAHHCC